MVIVYSCLLYIAFLCFVLFSLSFFVDFFLYMNKILPTLKQLCETLGSEQFLTYFHVCHIIVDQPRSFIKKKITKIFEKKTG